MLITPIHLSILNDNHHHNAIGRCYLELGDYRRSCSMYQLSRRVEVNRVEGMEWYSTALWHLQRKKELSYLAQQMTEFDKLAPETWFVSTITTILVILLCL
jgi:hypothetical protein